MLWEYYKLAAQAQNEKQLVIKVTLWDQKNERICKVDTMIDIGATGNFILPDIIFIFGIDTRIKIIFYKLLVVNREAINTNGGIVNIKINELIIEIPGEYLEFITFDMVLIG